jgi:hypothetical protein
LPLAVACVHTAGEDAESICSPRDGYNFRRPCRAFTRRRIADALSSKRDPVVEDTVDRHVASLLNQLGVFHDYVQCVPYIGYRFKAYTLKAAAPAVGVSDQSLRAVLPN